MTAGAGARMLGARPRARGAMTTAGAGAARSARRVEASERLIVALDVPSADQARAIVEALDGAASFFKIGLHLQLVPGTEQLITEIVAAGNRVFLDYKIADIGASMKAAIRAAAHRGVSFMTIQGGGDLTGDIVTAALEGRVDARPASFGVTVLTSLSDADCRRLHGGQSVAEPGDVRDSNDGGDDGGQVVGKRGWKQRGREGVAGGQEIGAELEG